MNKITVVSMSNDTHLKERQLILSELLEAVKACQIKYGGKSELATESDSQVKVLCRCFEDVFSHGLRTRPQYKTPNTLEQVTGLVAHTFRYSQEPLCFWHFVRVFLTKHELDRYLSLKNVWTDVGRGRAWLRSSLNERSLERYLSMLLSNPKDATVFYNDWALVLDQELNSTLPNMAAGLGPILFAISIDVGRLNQSANASEDCHLSRSEPVLAIPTEDVSQHRRRKKVPAHIVSFDSVDVLPGPNPGMLSTSAESASVLVTGDDAAQVFLAEKPAIPVSGCSPSPSSTESSLHEFDASLPKQQESLDSIATLTPVNDEGNVGELMLISTDELPGDEVSLCDGDDISVEGLLGRRGTELSSSEVDELYATVEQLIESNSGLRTKLKNLISRHRGESVNTESRLLTLTRENEVLKHQLRKYVSAVQMLNKDGAAHEALAYLEASHVAATQREEATKYQEQLVQVAQMHGELMEFNEKLQRVLLAKEEVIKRLERELTNLRGPLPLGTVWEDDSSPPAPDTLVNIWIPSAFLTSGTSGVHHLYQVYVRIRDIEWNTYRRYAQFYSLHKELKKQFPVISTLDFPPKKTIGNKDAKFVEERRQRLQRYLRQAIDIVSSARPDMTDPPSFIKIIPFFGQQIGTNDENKKSQKRSTKKSSRTSNASQYNGL